MVVPFVFREVLRICQKYNVIFSTLQGKHLLTEFLTKTRPKIYPLCIHSKVEWEYVLMYVFKMVCLNIFNTLVCFIIKILGA
jgi:hypothetical protein